MYKLFLCLRYLRRRYIALVAIVGVTLCVAMVLIVISVMNGFLDLVEGAARGMMGDVIVDATSPGGLGQYDEFMAELDKLPNVKATSPVIYSYGVLGIGADFKQGVRIVGLRLPDAARVTTFAEGLTPPQSPADATFQPPPEMLERFEELARQYEQQVLDLEARVAQYEQALAAVPATEPAQQELARKYQVAIEQNEQYIAELRRLIYRPQQPGIALGIDIGGISERDEATGEYRLALQPGATVTLTTAPMGRGRVSALAQPVTKSFTLIGHSRMGIYQIDSQHVYVPFDVLQTLMDMGDRTDIDTGEVDPARANQILITARQDGEAALEALTKQVEEVWQRVVARHPEQARVQVEVRTWRQKQSQFIGPIEKQRTLVVLMFGVISLVAVVLVFAIFYMMVVQKTRDIGILKSIGGSSGGVAGIFRMYGAAVGVVGSAAGVVMGWLFVHYINQIHDWIATVFQWRVFDRRAFMFDRIPNTVELPVIYWVVIGAIAAGLLGSMLPALRAARMQPVEALRYE
jgi:lipoprotein-releasing system permease protein